MTGALTLLSWTCLACVDHALWKRGDFADSDGQGSDSAATVSVIAPQNPSACADVTWTPLIEASECGVDIQEPFALAEAMLLACADSAAGAHAYPNVGRFVDTNGDDEIDADDRAVVLAGSRQGALVISIEEHDVTCDMIGSENDDVQHAVAFADLGGAVGPEVFLNVQRAGAPGVAAYSGGGELWVTDLDSSGGEAVESLLLTILDDASAPSLLAGLAMLDPATGDLVSLIDGSSKASGGAVLAALDIDLDGLGEVLAWNHATGEFLFADNRGVRTTSPRYLESYPGIDGEMPVVMIVNVDDDSSGEVVLAQDHVAALIDTDGTVLRSAVFRGASMPRLVNPIQPIAAQLDLDSGLEFILGSEGTVIALDSDLTVLWTHESRAEYQRSWTNLVAADLDGDQVHEVVVHEDTTVVVLGADGSVLSELSTSLTLGGGVNSLSVFDVDRDGLSEILVPGFVEEVPTSVVVESVEGGWPLARRDQPWVANSPFPYARDVDGTLPSPGGQQFWLEPDNNVWNAVPLGVSMAPDLIVEIIDVCVDDCGAAGRVMVAVTNVGLGDVERGVEIAVRLAGIDGDVAAATVDGLDAGTYTLVEFGMPAALLSYGIVAVVDTADAVAECSEDNNDDSWSEGWCE